MLSELSTSLPVALAQYWAVNTRWSRISTNCDFCAQVPDWQFMVTLDEDLFPSNILYLILKFKML